MKKGLSIAMVITGVLLIVLLARSCSCACGTVTKKEPDNKGELWVTLDNAHVYWASKDEFEEAKVGERWCYNH